MNYKRNTLLCGLLLVASLSSCAPTLQGLGGTAYHPKVQSGISIFFVKRVALADLQESTPNTAYVEFPNCQNVVVSVEDVRKLGVESALNVCLETTKSIDQFTRIAMGVASVAGLVLGYFFYRLLDIVFSGPTYG